MIDERNRLKELKKYCRSLISKPDYLTDSITWTYAWHIIRTYYAYVFTREIITEAKSEVVCIDISYLWQELKDYAEPEDYFLISHYIHHLAEAWLELATELEEFEVSQNIKNVFDFCDE